MQKFPLLPEGAVRLTQCSEHKIDVGLRHLEILFLPAFLGFVVMYNYLGRCAGSYLICLRFLSSYGAQFMSHMSHGSVSGSLCCYFSFCCREGVSNCLPSSGRNVLQLAQQIGVIGFQSVFVHFLFPLCFFALVQFLFQPLLFGGQAPDGLFVLLGLGEKVLHFRRKFSQRRFRLGGSLMTFQTLASASSCKGITH